jgi:hypothetical protein
MRIRNPGENPFRPTFTILSVPSFQFRQYKKIKKFIIYPSKVCVNITDTAQMDFNCGLPVSVKPSGEEQDCSLAELQLRSG